MIYSICQTGKKNVDCLVRTGDDVARLYTDMAVLTCLMLMWKVVKWKTRG
jgi:hypothetical protein